MQTQSYTTEYNTYYNTVSHDKQRTNTPRICHHINIRIHSPSHTESTITHTQAVLIAQLKNLRPYINPHPPNPSTTISAPHSILMSRLNLIPAQIQIPIRQPTVSYFSISHIKHHQIESKHHARHSQPTPSTPF